MKRWISAVCSLPPSLVGLPDEYDHRVVTFKGSYPLYLLEKDNEFTEVSITGTPSDDDPHENEDLEDCALYTFKQDWHSPKPGEDQMGLLHHVHFNYDKHMKLVFPTS
jgi:hypothetical protein